MKGVLQMANFSPHYNLELPVTPEHYDIGVFNKNNLVIDSELNKLDLKDQNQNAEIAAETSRAISKENEILESLSHEITRAINAETTLGNELSTLSGNTLNTHTHENKETLDKITENETGDLMFNGEKINNSGENDPITPESIGAASSEHTHGSMKTITYSTTEPTTVAEGEIVMVYEV